MLRTEEMLLNVGPQHPSTHGVFRIVLKIDGEIIREATAGHWLFTSRDRKNSGESAIYTDHSLYGSNGLPGSDDK